MERPAYFDRGSWLRPAGGRVTELRNHNSRFKRGTDRVDIGGVHGATSQTIDLDRLNWLQSGHTYSLKLFFAERHTTESNVRIDTTINLQNATLPPSTGLFD